MQDSRPAFPHMSKPYRETRRTEKFAGRSAASIFFGGGTPSLLAPIQIKAIINTCASVFDLARVAKSRSRPTPTISTKNIARLYSSWE